jgi:RNA recognition motif-containing protein
MNVQGVPHANLYVRGFSASFTEADLLALFGPFGELTSCRLVGGTGGVEQTSATQAAPHAFVRYAQPEQAAAAIQALNGAPVPGGQLVVKFADADVQPRVESGRQPSEWCYCRNLPASYTRQDVGEMFLPFGTVLEIRLFPSTELYKGSGALVQLQSMEQAAAAIQTLNGSFPRGATQPLLVRYADSPAEKAAKQARKERLLHKQAAGMGLLVGNSNLLAAQLQQQLLGLAINGSSRSAGLSSSIGAGSPQRSEDLGMSGMSIEGYGDLPGAAAVLQSPALSQMPAASTGGAASLYIKGMPEDADKLWLYEKFARFGGITSVRVLIDDQTGKCNGIGFVNYTSAEAARAAQEAMNGVSMGDRLLHVMVQNPAGRPGRTPSSTPAGAPPLGMAQLGGVQGLQSHRPALPPSVFQAAGNLGLNASTLASLQAGLIPASSAGMQQLQASSLPLAVGGQPYNGSMAQQQTGFGSLQW